MLYYAEFFHTPHKVLLIPQAALIIADVYSASELALLITLYYQLLSLYTKTVIHLFDNLVAQLCIINLLVIHFSSLK